MPSYDFEVDLESLVKAARGVADTVQLFKDKDVEDLVPTESSLGSDVVWGAVKEFKDRWERGMNHLVGDVEEISGRLSQVAGNYAEFDADGAKAMEAVTGRVRQSPRFAR